MAEHILCQEMMINDAKQNMNLVLIGWIQTIILT